MGCFFDGFRDNVYFKKKARTKRIQKEEVRVSSGCLHPDNILRNPMKETSSTVVIQDRPDF